MAPRIYHEKQVKALCALHALNNLLQDGNAFRKEDLDRICYALNPKAVVNPHKSVFGWGSYDINVIMAALQEKKLEAIWFDKRKDPFDELNFSNIFGILLNIPANWKFAGLTFPVKGKHWVAIRGFLMEDRIDYYNLDSNNEGPKLIGSEEDLIEYLRNILKSSEKEVFVIVKEEIEKSQTWRKHTITPPPTSPTIADSNELK